MVGVQPSTFCDLFLNFFFLFLSQLLFPTVIVLRARVGKVLALC